MARCIFVSLHVSFVVFPNLHNCGLCCIFDSMCFLFVLCSIRHNFSLLYLQFVIFSIRCDAGNPKRKDSTMQRMQRRSLGGAQPGNRFVSFVRAYARSGCLMELDLKRSRSPFSLFPFWPGKLSLFVTPTPQTSYPTLIGLIGTTTPKYADSKIQRIEHIILNRIESIRL